MALDLIAPIIDLISNVSFAIRNRNSGKTVTHISTPVACLTFLFFGFVIGGFSFAFYQSFHLLGTLLFLFLLALFIGVAIWRGIISLGFKLSGWSVVMYAGFFIAGFAALYLGFAL